MVIIEESNIANGKARGTIVAAKYAAKRITIKNPRPLPTKSSIYNQKNCITNTNTAMKNVAIKGPINAFTIRISNFLINGKN